ncbi:hypothetical protein EV175_002969 [Coemansia sp. RSA 1933]|nr:hypothetical protein EV175_002969 [Coemansia sp. RSA 1933]
MPAQTLKATTALLHSDSNKSLVGGRSLNAYLKALHQKASRSLILGQGSTAWAQCREAIQHCSIERLASEYGEQQARQLCCRLWILYICVLSSLTEVAEEDGRLQPKGALGGGGAANLAEFPDTVREVWGSIVSAFGGYAGNVDSEVLVPTVLLCLKLRDAKTARNIVEAWLATLPDDTMYLLQEDCASGAQNIDGTGRQQHRTMMLASYMRVCELYTLHILPQLDDFPSAYDFLTMSSVVSPPAKDEFTRRLDSLRSPSPAPKKKKSKTKHRRQKAAKPKSSEDSHLQASSATATAPSSVNVDGDGIEGGENTPKSLNAPLQDKGKAKEQPATIIPTQTKQYNRPSIKDLRHRSTATASSSSSYSRAAVRTRAVARRPRNIASIAWQVVRRLFSRWGFTLFTLAIVAAVLRMLTRRFRLPPFFTAVYRKLWSTFKMGTQVTYL